MLPFWEASVLVKMPTIQAHKHTEGTEALTGELLLSLAEPSLYIPRWFTEADLSASPPSTRYNAQVVSPTAP